jgi:hypothetical protein
MILILQIAAGVFLGIIAAQQFDTCKGCGHWRLTHKTIAVAGGKCAVFEQD